MPTSLADRRRRWLDGARLAVAWALCSVAQVAVDMPQGYFGAADRMTRFGAGYAALLTVTALLLATALGGGRRWAAWGLPLLFAANVGLFAPALVSDPVVAGAVLLWNLYLLFQHLFPAPQPAAPPAAHRAGREWLVRRGPALRHLATASLLLTLAVVGYRLSGHPLAQSICLLLDYATLAAASPLLLRLARQGRRSVWLIAAAVAASLLALGSAAAMLSLLAVAHTLLLLLLLSQQQSTLEVLSDFYRNPSWLIIASFAGVILVGTVLLTFPAASAGPTPVAPLDALFTATSATCVTGLVVLDTPHDLSLLGQGIVLGLVQLGGLGIMVVSTFATLLLGGSLGLRGEQALTELMDLRTASAAYRLTRFIVLATLAVEGVGALALTGFYAAEGFALGGAAWRGLFHAVSAFCNAGFALQSDSLLLFRDDPGAVLVIAALVILGGLGFAVLAVLWTRLGSAVGVGREPARRGVLNTQVKVVLAVSAVLLVAGTALYAALEWQRTLAGLPPGGRLLHAFFQSVTLRTAGFNSVDLAALAPATALFMMLFMFVGASPGSTGGGIKTTTAAVLVATLRAAVGRGEPARLFDREIPTDVVLRSLAILVISAAAVLTGLFTLLVFEDHAFLPLAFEVVSAFGTVGLSLGVTPALGPVGKLLVTTLMFVGRIGPLTLALVLGTGARRRGAVLRHPESRLMVG